jgi:hypothetical protein
MRDARTQSTGVREDHMKYLLGGTALLLLVFSSAAMADNVFNCQDVGVTTPEPIGDQDGHVLHGADRYRDHMRDDCHAKA